MRAVAAPPLAIPPLAGLAVPLFGVPEWAPRRPSRREALGIGRTGWLAAMAFHAALAAALLIGLPRTAPEPWPEDAAFVELVFEPPPAPKAAPTEPAPRVAETPPPNVADMLPPIEVPPPVETAEIPPEAAPPEPALAEPAEVEPAPLAASLPPPEPAPVASVEPVPLPRPKPVHAALPRPGRPAAAPRPAPAEAAAPLSPAPVSPAPVPPAPHATAPPQAAMLPIVPPQPVGFAAGNRRPDYPADARRRGWQGQVVLRVEVSADGRPETVAVLTSSGHKSLDEAALAAVRLWRFRPAVQGGAPVAAPADVPVRFRLED